MRIILLLITLAACLPSVSFAASLTEQIVVDPSVRDQLSKPLTLVYGNKIFVVPAKTLRGFVKFKQEGDTTFMRLVPGAIYDFLNVNVSPVVNEPGEEVRVVFRNGISEIKELAKDGKIVDGVKTSFGIRDALAKRKTSASVYMKRHVPEVASLKDFTKLGIKDKIGQGVSSFAGSPKNRIKNIEVGRLRVQGLLIAPDEEFSLNKYLGPVTEENGYLPELVIKEKTTKPEFGGGLCQVSTTLFRAAINAGLKITERHNHAYPVAYYGKPGFDATIYIPKPDLRFKNNTGRWLMVQSSVEGSKLIFDFYGVNDGRVVKTDGPHTVEKLPDGSLKTLFRQTVVDKKGKEVINDLFKSEYKSEKLFPTERKTNGE